MNKNVLGIAAAVLATCGVLAQNNESLHFQARKTGDESAITITSSISRWVQEIDLTSRRGETKYSRVILPTTSKSIRKITLTGHHLTGLEIPPMMKHLREIVLDGNVDLNKLKIQQDTCVGGNLAIKFAGMRRLVIDAPKRLRGKIKVHGRDAGELHPQVSVSYRDDEIEIVKWPRPVFRFTKQGAPYDYWHQKTPPAFETHVGLCSLSGKQIEFVTGPYAFGDPWAPIDWKPYLPEYLRREERWERYLPYARNNSYAYNPTDDLLPPLFLDDEIETPIRFWDPDAQSNKYKCIAGWVYEETDGGLSERWDDCAYKEYEKGAWVEEVLKWEVVNYSDHSLSLIGGNPVFFRVKP